MSWSPTQFDAADPGRNRDRGIVLEGYSPLKNTNLRAKELFEIAEAHGVTPAQVVLRWHVQHEIPVIPRSQNPERIAANFDVFGFEPDRRRDGPDRRDGDMSYVSVCATRDHSAISVRSAAQWVRYAASPALVAEYVVLAPRP